MSRARRVKRTLAVLATLVVAGAALFLLLTRARPRALELPPHTPDLARGETLFHVGGCLGCHAPAKGAGDPALPSGGAPFETPFGTFYPQNLTPDADTGLGRFSDADFVHAMREGISPGGLHYFPAFPYTSYARMPVEDLLDLRGYLASLTAVRSPSRPADVPLVWLARRSVGLWKRRGLDDRLFAADPTRSEQWNRGAYLVNGPGHCGECHTPRDVFMVLDERRALAGGKHPRGEDEDVPSLRDLVGREHYTDAADLVLALQYGETYGYEHLSSGGMAIIQQNLALLPEAELQAIAEYLVSLR